MQTTKTTTNITSTQGLMPENKKIELMATIFGKYTDTIIIKTTNAGISIKVNDSGFQKSYNSVVDYKHFKPEQALRALLVINSVLKKATISQSDKTTLTKTKKLLETKIQSSKLSVLWEKKNALNSEDLQGLGINMKDIIQKTSTAPYFRKSKPGPFTESAERTIKKITVTNNNKGDYSDEFNHDLGKIAAAEGFHLNIVQTKDITNPEDGQIVLNNGNSISPTSDDIYDRIKNTYIYVTPSSFSDKTHPDYRRSMGSAIRGRFEEDQLKYDTGIIKEKRSYFEGGNTLSLLDDNKDKIVIMGQTSYDINEGLYIEKHLSNNDIKIEHAKGGSAAVHEFIDRKTHKFIADDLSINPEQLLFIPQIGLHIDTYLRPGLNGQIFVHDWEMSVKLLTQLLKIKDISANEKNYYSAFLKHAQGMNKNYKEEYKELYKKLNEYGLTAIRIPGDFYCKKKGNVEQKRINFMNGVMGTGNNGTFFITNGSNFPRLNNIVASMFYNFGIENIYFAGRSVDNFSYAPAESSILEFDSGVDCRTLEYPETK